MRLGTWIMQKGITFGGVAWLFMQWIMSRWFLVQYLSKSQRHMIGLRGDPVRYGTLYLSLEQISKNNIPGAFAECGVYKGKLSKFLHEMLPDRRLFLFDTFRGFDSRDTNTLSDARFQDTSQEGVLRSIGDTRNIVIRKGFFPETALGLEEERFAFVMIDFDKYEPTLAALEFFYPRTHKNGFIFVHDYSSSESDWACSKALDEFLADKPEKPVLIPDAWGTALFRKV
jgi:O-methyltransferase